MYGSFLRSVRRSNGPTQVESGGIAGLAQANMSAYEDDRWVPTLETVNQIVVEGAAWFAFSVGDQVVELPFLSASDLVVFKLSLNRLKDWADVNAMVATRMLIDPEDVQERPVAFRGPTMCPRMAHLAPATGLGLTQQGGSRLESAGCDGPPDPAAALLTHDEARLGEDLGVVRDGRLAPVERALQVAAAGLTLGGDDREESQPDGVAECGEDLGRLVGVSDGERVLAKGSAAQLVVGVIGRCEHRGHESTFH